MLIPSTDTKAFLYSPFAGSITRNFIFFFKNSSNNLYDVFDLPDPVDPVIKQCDEKLFRSKSTSLFSTNPICITFPSLIFLSLQRLLL